MTSTLRAPATARDRRDFWILLLIALVVLGAGIGLRDPWPSDEPRFALAAKQMVDFGDWLFPHRGIELYADKPPLLFWLQAATYEVVRNWRIAFLLPSLLAGLLTLGLTYDLGRRLWTRRVGLFAAAALLVTFQFGYQFKRAQIDPLVTCWITLANWGLLLHLLRGPNWRAYWLGCFAAGLGVITKGVGVLALLMFVPYLFARWRGWEGVTRTTASAGRWLAGPLAFLIAIGLWIVPMLWIAHARGTAEYANYVRDILFHQTAGRYAHSWDHYHSALYYVPIVLFSWFPLSLAYAGAVPRWRRALRDHDARILLPLAWVVLLIVFFCIPRGKRDVYLMPALPMLALATAPYLEEMIRTRWMRIAAFTITLGAGIVLLALAASAYFGHSLLPNPELRSLPPAGSTEWGIVMAIGAAMLGAGAWFRVRRGVHGVFAWMAALWLIWGLWGYPAFNAANSAAGVMQRTNEIIGPDAELGMVAWKEQNYLMAGRPVHDFGFLAPWPVQFAAAVRWLDDAPQRRWIFILGDAMGKCVERTKAMHVGRANRREWWLFRADAVVPGCVPATGDDNDAD
jgi:4-amino-4-deoxy-L-arabinose transferase-like glycosyltransferase